jgi:aryl-alcohol dehydrogenase-like predicted oxidoreductase
MTPREFSRRALLGSSLGAISALALARAAAEPGLPAPAPAPPPSPTPLPRASRKRAADVVMLGATGIQVSRLALGTGTHGFGHNSDQTRLGAAGLVGVLRHGLDQGLNFWETADQYGAHGHLKRGLCEVGRNKIVLLTKTHAKTAEEAEADLMRFLEELGTDHIDIVLLHNMQSASWATERSGAMEYLERAKQKGIIRAHGVSCHTLGALRLAARTPWVDVDLARINPAGAHMDAEPETVIEVLNAMKRAKKAVIGMKILGQGALKDRLDAAVSHAVGLDALDAFTIGFTSRAQVSDMIRRIERA